MKSIRTEFWSVLLYTFSVLAVPIYLYGFFPIEYSLKVNSERTLTTKDVPTSPVIDKLAIIVIDALRYDFVMPNGNKKLMPFTLSSILNNQSCLLSATAHSPTVTMPRIKALTSGMVPTYIDVVLNFMSSDFKEDNFINTAQSKGLKLIFYGDETWLKLFPKSFIRSEGTSSFFTMDYTEVDNNVTRHLNDEFDKDDWDIIILHYLGLDHIGHVEGPSSSLIQPKLEEMDSVIEKFYHFFKKLNEEKGKRSMLIVTSDHGMKESGGHGGVTYSEITVPLISVGNPCNTLEGWPKKYTPLQIDVAPTLSALFGLPLPEKNIGKIIPSFLHGMETNMILKWLEINRLHFEKFDALFADGNIASAWHSNNNSPGKTVVNYYNFLNQYSQEMLQKNSNFKLSFLVLGVVLIWIFLIILIYLIAIHISKPKSIIHWFFILGTLFHSLSFFSSSLIEEEHQTWYFFWATFCLLMLIKVLNSNISTIKKRKLFSSWILISLLHRILRKLNQTGDKWIFLPDIKNFLNSDIGQPYLFFLFIAAIGMIFLCVFGERCSRRQVIAYGMTLLAVVLYRIATGNFNIEYLKFYPSSRGSAEVFIFWVCLSIFSALSFLKKTSFHLIWLLLATLFLRPHNVILLPAEIYISRQIYKVFNTSEDLFWINISHVWLGNLFYFYQGNGNSLSNVDVASGFVGIQTYNPFYAGVMMAAHTYNSHILSFLLSPRLSVVYAVSRIIPLAVYCTTLIFQLHHLFIWSVFSPKLLYESSHTLVFFVIMTVNYFFVRKLNSSNKN